MEGGMPPSSSLNYLSASLAFFFHLERNHLTLGCVQREQQNQTTIFTEGFSFPPRGQNKSYTDTRKLLC